MPDFRFKSILTGGSSVYHRGAASQCRATTVQCRRLDEFDIVGGVLEVTNYVAATSLRVHIVGIVSSGARLLSRSARLVEEPILVGRPVLGARVPAKAS